MGEQGMVTNNPPTTDRMMISIKQQTVKPHRMSLVQKVPWKMRNVKANKKIYDPLVVSIGPFHYGKPQYIQMEKNKSTVLGKFSSFLSDDGIDIQYLYRKVLEIAGKAMTCYAKGSLGFTISRKRFADIMFVDGCFLVFFIYCVMEGKSDLLGLRNDAIVSVTTDLFLLENQLPFLVIHTLMSFVFPQDAGNGMLNEFVEVANRLVSEDYYRYRNENLPLHLLDLLWMKLVESNDPRDRSHSAGTCYSMLQRLVCFCSFGYCCSVQSRKEHFLLHSIRSAKELRTVGINFKMSKSCSYKSAQFRPGLIYGDVLLPRIVIDISAKARFLNLIAYETCFDHGHDDLMITSWICFLDSLIDHADDVKELRSDGVLVNFLGSDEEAAELINGLARDVADPNKFSAIRGEIGRFSKEKWRVSVTEMLSTHFRSPWTAIAFFAASFVIILTAIQTYYTVFS